MLLPVRLAGLGFVQAQRWDDVTMDARWMEDWIASVAEGQVTMSQRSAASIERNGGLGAAVTAARAKGVHLVRLIDDKGKVLIAASLHPFEPLC